MRLVLALLLCSLCVSAMPHVSVVGVANSLPWTEFLAVTTESRSMAQVTQEISDELVTQLVHEMFTQRAWPMLLASITIGDAPKITSSVTESVTYLLEDPTIIATLTLDITKKSHGAAFRKAADAPRENNRRKCGKAAIAVLHRSGRARTDRSPDALSQSALCEGRVREGQTPSEPQSLPANQTPRQVLQLPRLLQVLLLLCVLQGAHEG
eukprot:gnl/Spiro4/16922_TR9126_c0_g1_i1.p1 gnl/Spiro4/16922_TR9126_c0_g1~~gnl/Spiro4/16922_TR9126_c0_g1_i1.p1  ORF type:complete len:210 (+),score=12.22 gnl/Spiro4/16922_TR9126_c0_g1_i1:90-719(+)